MVSSLRLLSGICSEQRTGRGHRSLDPCTHWFVSPDLGHPRIKVLFLYSAECCRRVSKFWICVGPLHCILLCQGIAWPFQSSVRFYLPHWLLSIWAKACRSWRQLIRAAIDWFCDQANMRIVATLLIPIQMHNSFRFCCFWIWWRIKYGAVWLSEFDCASMGCLCSKLIVGWKQAERLWACSIPLDTSLYERVRL